MGMTYKDCKKIIRNMEEKLLCEKNYVIVRLIKDLGRS
jgi:hypothetical protein